MSYKNFEVALELAKNCTGYLIGGTKSDVIISKAEELLNLKLSKQNREYFSRLGFLEFDGNEIYGIVKDDFSGTPTGCAVEAALVDRNDYSLPNEWLPIFFFDDGFMAYLDYGQLNEDGEPPVIMAHYNGKEYIIDEKISDDFGDFLLKLVNER